MPYRVSSTLFCGGLVLVLLMAGCGDETGLDVAKGRYRLFVEGSLTDTLTGPSFVRAQRNGHVGIELGPRDGPGLSIELASPPRPDPDADGSLIRSRVQPGRYDVVAASLLNGPRADSLTGLLAFLSVNDAEFEATQGHLLVTHIGDGSVGGTFDMKMKERTNGPLGDRSVRVTGVLRATPP